MRKIRLTECAVLASFCAFGNMALAKPYKEVCEFTTNPNRPLPENSGTLTVRKGTDGSDYKMELIYDGKKLSKAQVDAFKQTDAHIDRPSSIPNFGLNYWFNISAINVTHLKTIPDHVKRIDRFHWLRGVENSESPKYQFDRLSLLVMRDDIDRRIGATIAVHVPSWGDEKQVMLPCKR